MTRRPLWIGRKLEQKTNGYRLSGNATNALLAWKVLDRLRSSRKLSFEELVGTMIEYFYSRNRLLSTVSCFETDVVAWIASASLPGPHSSTTSSSLDMPTISDLRTRRRLRFLLMPVARESAT